MQSILIVGERQQTQSGSPLFPIVGILVQNPKNGQFMELKEWFNSNKALESEITLLFVRKNKHGYGSVRSSNTINQLKALLIKYFGGDVFIKNL